MAGSEAPAPRRISVPAFAKINLSLRVLGVRRDGYHRLRTTYQTLELHDTLVLTPRPGPFEIRCGDPGCPTDRTNLVWRAAEAVWRAGGHRGPPEGVRVRLDKRIPMQTGLGGGSSDGAAAIAAFARLWRVAGRARLAGLARGLGADVAFFLEGGTALGVGRGDRLRLLPDAPAASVVLVVPDFGVNTADAYRWWDARDGAGRPGWGNRGVNDLQAVVGARHPEIARFVDGLTRAGAVRAAMTGSGSAVFGLFDTRRGALAAARALAGSARQVLVTRTLSRFEFRKRSRPRSV